MTFCSGTEATDTKYRKGTLIIFIFYSKRKNTKEKATTTTTTKETLFNIFLLKLLKQLVDLLSPLKHLLHYKMMSTQAIVHQTAI